MKDPLLYPFDPLQLIRQKKKLRRTLSERGVTTHTRIAILGGSTTAEFKDMLEIFLLGSGIKPEFYECDYGQYYEAAVFENQELQKFQPQLACVFTSFANITHLPAPQDSEDRVQESLRSEQNKLHEIWDKLSQQYNCTIIQNNFELPRVRVLGNLDFSAHQGGVHFIHLLNQYLAKAARERGNLHICDINYLSSWMGLQNWYDPNLWHSYKYAMSFMAVPYIAHNVAAMIRGIHGSSKKCLVLDLDNTLWGGVIGDDGLSGIKMGKDTPVGEAFSDFQAYIKALKERGIILAVCSKNEEENARQGLTHPDSKLSAKDFTCIKANWEPKHFNLSKISNEINIGLESLVFVDDNPAERELVAAQMPQISVPNVGGRVEHYMDILDKGNYFETVSLTEEDLKRSAQYNHRAEIQAYAQRFESYDEFLTSLQMRAEIQPFSNLYVDRITQLINKTNQFNLTNKRLSLDEVKSIAADAGYLALYGKLQDKFGDSGLITSSIGRIQGDELHIEVWVMSCRVLKRSMEHAMFQRLRKSAEDHGLRRIFGYYKPTEKNRMVKNLYHELGFELMKTAEKEEMVWLYDIEKAALPPKALMEILK